MYLKKIIKRTGVRKATRNPIMILSGEKCCRMNGNNIEKQNISNKAYNFWIVKIDFTSIACQKIKGFIMLLSIEMS